MHCDLEENMQNKLPEKLPQKKEDNKHLITHKNWFDYTTSLNQRVDEMYSWKNNIELIIHEYGRNQANLNHYLNQTNFNEYKDEVSQKFAEISKQLHQIEVAFEGDSDNSVESCALPPDLGLEEGFTPVSSTIINS